MERVNISALGAGVLLALVQDVAVNKDKRAGFNLTHIVHLLLVRGWLGPQAIRELRSAVLDKASTLLAVLACTYKPLGNGRAPVASCRKAQTPVLFSCILERIPKSYCARRVRVQEGAVLMRRHGATNLRLLADDHGLENARIAEAQVACNSCVLRGHGDVVEARGQFVEVVSNLVDGALFGLAQIAILIEGILEN